MEREIKVGDKIRITKAFNSHPWLHGGQEYEILELNQGGSIHKVKDIDMKYYYFERCYEYELVQSPLMECINKIHGTDIKEGEKFNIYDGGRSLKYNPYAPYTIKGNRLYDNDNNECHGLLSRIIMEANSIKPIDTKKDAIAKRLKEAEKIVAECRKELEVQ